MSSPIHLDDDTDPTSIYPPSWARERILPVAEPPFRSRAHTTAAAEMSSGKFKPKFSGDRAMLALQRQLALDPDLIPEPSSKGTAVIWPLLIRLCSVSALAAFVAWGLVSYSGVKKSAGITTSIPTIASDHSKVVDVQPSQLRPTLSQAAEAITPAGNSQPVAISSKAAAVTSAPVPVTAQGAAEPGTLAPTPPVRANDRQPLRPDSEEIATLIKRGKDLLDNDDLSAARSSFAVLPRRAAPKAPSCSDRHLTQLCSSASARLARDRILSSRGNGTNVLPSSVQVPPRSNWRASRTVVEVVDVGCCKGWHA